MFILNRSTARYVSIGSESRSQRARAGTPMLLFHSFHRFHPTEASIAAAEEEEEDARSIPLALAAHGRVRVLALRVPDRVRARPFTGAARGSYVSDHARALPRPRNESHRARRPCATGTRRQRRRQQPKNRASSSSSSRQPHPKHTSVPRRALRAGV